MKQTTIIPITALLLLLTLSCTTPGPSPPPPTATPATPPAPAYTPPPLPPGAPPAPDVSHSAWLGPTFHTTEGNNAAGSAFVARVEPGKPLLLLTVHHLLGPAGGFERQIGWSEVEAVVERVEARPLIEQEIRVVSTAPINLEGARAMDDAGLDGELVAFALERDSGVPALELAEGLPEVGEVVWLLSPQRIEDTVGFWHPAKVLFAEPNYLEYVFFDESLTIGGTSGAPVLDQQGEVVAINVGGATLDAEGAAGVDGAQEGDLVGIGNPAVSMRRLLGTAGLIAGAGE